MSHRRYKNKFGSGPIYMEVLDQTIMHMFGDAPFFDTAVTQGAFEYFTYGEGYKLNGNKTDYDGMEVRRLLRTNNSTINLKSYLF
jgi:hypothetical protein